MSIQREQEHEAPFNGASPWLYSIRSMFASGELQPVFECTCRYLRVAVLRAEESIWVWARWPSGGGMAFRTSYCPEQQLKLERCAREDDSGTVECISSTP